MTVPAELDSMIDQLSVLLPVTANDQLIMTTSTATAKATSAEHCEDDRKQGSGLRIGRTLSPVKGWDYHEEAEVMAMAEELHTVHGLMLEAYRLTRDYRLKRLVCAGGGGQGTVLFGA